MTSNLSSSIKLTIISPKKPFRIVVVNWIIKVILLTYFILFIFIKDTNHIIGISFLCTTVLILLVLFLLKKEHQYSKNYLTINKTGIETFIDNETTKYSIEEIDNLSFLYVGYKGEYNPITNIAHSGLENKLTFNDNEYIVYITADDIDPLNYFLRCWKKTSNNVVIKSLWGNILNEIK